MKKTDGRLVHQSASRQSVFDFFFKTKNQIIKTDAEFDHTVVSFDTVISEIGRSGAFTKVVLDACAKLCLSADFTIAKHILSWFVYMALWQLFLIDICQYIMTVLGIRPLIFGLWRHSGLGNPENPRT